MLGHLIRHDISFEYTIISTVPVVVEQRAARHPPLLSSGMASTADIFCYHAIILAALEHFSIEGNETAIQIIGCHPVNDA